MPLLLLALLVVPAVEIGVFIWIGNYIGALWVVLLILITGGLGIMFARNQGLRMIRDAQMSMAAGQIPGSQMVEGVCILAGGILLLAPGFVTDAVGLFLVIPFTRKFVYGIILEYLRRKMMKGNFLFRRF